MVVLFLYYYAHVININIVFIFKRMDIDALKRIINTLVLNFLCHWPLYLHFWKTWNLLSCIENQIVVNLP